MSDIERREQVRSDLVDRLYAELIGPKPDEAESKQTEELEASPLSLYGAGILFPKRAVQNFLEDSQADAQALDEVHEDLEDTVNLDAGSRTSNVSSDAVKEEPALNLANEFSPSAMGITFKTNQCSRLAIRLTAGRYAAERKNIPHPKAGEKRRDGSNYPDSYQRTYYRRTSILEDIPVDLSESPLDIQKIKLRQPNDALYLHVTSRKKSENVTVVSVMAVNSNECDADAFPNPEEAFFQVNLDVTDSDGKDVFESVDRSSGYVQKGEQESLELQYRHRRSFALGHGCAGDWDRSPAVESSGRTGRVRTASMPTYEVMPIRPRESAFKKEGLNLSMAFLSGDGEKGIDEIRQEITASLSSLCDDYTAWIDDQEKKLDDVQSVLVGVGKEHIRKCRECCDRMRQGIECLVNDQTAFLAFRLANRAMLMQQFHYGHLKSRTADSPMPEIPDGYKDLPGPERRWRPFQLAFVLMNLAGTVDAKHDDRGIVDLIWFPTGGGKTEAYLGLAAFSICLRRLRKDSDAGTAVLMRYTLRLLTAQQFERASALILSLDVMRQERVFDADLGVEPITIGLWVGKSLSPNKRAEARTALKELHKPNSYAKNPFQVLECPWCKMQMDEKSNLGYSLQRVRAGEATKMVAFRCVDSRCRWGSTDSRLPIFVVDEDMYEKPPTLLIGTVDKFAQVSWSDQVGRFFGIGTDYSPPSLIIQDELHLISGPLGTVVGLYETAIERLCSRSDEMPKIVASTATIRSAGEQCKALYNRPYFEFPPAGLTAGESYFAYEDWSSPGRLYVGVFGSGLKSHATAQVRTCSAILQGIMKPYGDQAVDEEAIKDPYGTAVWYFNSLRELGHALTLCTGDIPEHIKGMCKRLEIPFEQQRKIREIVELTSRRTADEIPKILQALNRKWVPKPEGQYPVDMLLATNMISVGVDVSRLGLMIVTGQPKTTSEYIQATSRVGRACPGLVVTVYNQGKSRDRSHFERFVAYHQALYQFVEPTSVTPFAAPARDRGLRGLLIALVRLSAGITSPAGIEGQEDRIQAEIDTILSRVRAVDEDEVDEVQEELDIALAEWAQLLPSEYGGMGGKPTTTTLAYPYGSSPDPIFQEKSWPVLTSMRNVDQSCEAKVVSTYGLTNRDASRDD